MAKHVLNALVLNQEEIAKDIFSLWIELPEIAKESLPGQFVNLYTKDKSMILPRPISICEVNKEKTALRLVYRIAGNGTKEFSKLQPKDEIKVLGPIGNGFPIDKNAKAICIGGGIGIPPMLETAKNLNNPIIIAGYRDELFLQEELKDAGELLISSESGEFGTKGNVMDVIKANNIKADIIYACGPLGLLKAVKEYGESNNIKTYISLEERMACGVGACLGCVVKTKEKDHHTHVNNTRVCTEGPVFDSTEVDI